MFVNQLQCRVLNLECVSYGQKLVIFCPTSTCQVDGPNSRPGGESVQIERECTRLARMDVSCQSLFLVHFGRISTPRIAWPMMTFSPRAGPDVMGGNIRIGDWGQPGSAGLRCEIDDG
jgi:hypothetical protein